jgi:hypothetical protein
MQILVREAKRPKDAWADGDAWQLQEKWPPKLPNPLPDHYRIIAGTVSITITKEDIKDCNDKVTGQKEIWNRKFVARSYDSKS